MRLIYDLFPCQTGSRFRGIGRFTFSLAEAMARLAGDSGRHDMYALANSFHPESVEALRQQLRPVLRPGRFSSYSYPYRDAAIANTLIQHAYQSVMPDAIVYATPFEGWSEDGLIALPCGNVPAALRVAVIYDFIPWLFPEHYLDRNPRYKKWYERRLMALHRFDLLLTISEATRQDAIRLLGIPPERVVNISGAASTMFRPMTSTADRERARQTMARFGIARPFVLYTGNVDYRKNQEGMLQAYARLPHELRRTHQLVLTQADQDLHGFQHKIRALGLQDNEVVVTGHVTDAELICLYTQCKVFVFPSLYEGFGLPILEAMACGAPVIAAGNSSIPEVVGRSDILFEASQPASIAATLQQVLTNDELRNELACYGIERAQQFSWDRTAKLAWDAIETSLAAQQATSLQSNQLTHLPKPRIAIVCPLSLPEMPSTQHCMAMSHLLSHYFEIDFFTEKDTPINAPLLQAAFAIYPHTELLSKRDRYAAVVYHVANSACHAFIVSSIMQCPGIAVLHDLHLDEPLNTLGHLPDMALALESEIIYSHGLQGLTGDSKGKTNRHVNRHVLESAQHLIFLDGALSDALQEIYPDAWLPPSTILPSSDAAAYARIIHASIGNNPMHTIRCLADALEESGSNENTLSVIAQHAAFNWRLRRQPRLLIDVTQLSTVDANSGIQRVVKKIAYEIGCMSAAELTRPLDLVHMKNGRLQRATAVIASLFGIDPHNIPEEEIAIHPGDTLLMLDSSWEQYSDFLAVFNHIRLCGGKIVTVVYDLIPLHLPQMCSAPLVNIFQRWFRMAAEQSDMLLCISQAVANDAANYIAQHTLLPASKKLDIGYWHLGANIDAHSNETHLRDSIHSIVAEKYSPLFLMVGTIEPRKGHAFVLAAFESLWKNGMEVHLCIAGKEGWHIEDTMQRLRTHPQLNKRLFLLEEFTDAEINVCYAAASALIAASVAEGFGLPIVEAALHKLPVLASDIPVFREVGGEGAQYFSLTSSIHLVDAIHAFCQKSQEERFVMASKIKTLTWKESAKELLRVIGC